MIPSLSILFRMLAKISSEKKKNRKLWHKEKGKKVNTLFYRLNLVDEYNLGMGNVDQSDQLRL